MKFRPPVALAPLLCTATLLVLGGCAAAPIPTPKYEQAFAYAPPRSPVTFPGTVRILVRYSVNPEVRAILLKYGMRDEWMPAFIEAVGHTMAADLGQSGLFTRATSDPAEPADYVLTVESVDVLDPEGVLLTRYELTDAHSGKVTRRQVRHVWPPSDVNAPMNVRIQHAMVVVKSALIEDLQGKESSPVKLEALTLAELVEATDASPTGAKTHNRAIIAAKTRQLPGLLRDSSTEALTSLVVKIEQAILDLNHECELNKDRAQQAIATAKNETSPAVADRLRELTISYRERIELLKPILGALKEEIANRNR